MQSADSIWHVAAGSLASLVRPAPATAAAAAPPASAVTLQRPPGQAGGSCTLSLTWPRCARLRLVSNARMCELSVQRSGDDAPAYVSTARAQPLPADGADSSSSTWYAVTMDLQGLAGCQLLQLKLLSLQGSKDTCIIRELASLPPADDGAEAASSASAGVSSSSEADAQQQARLQQQRSQLDELRVLIDRVQQGAGSAAADVPESLQLLYSKAVQPPRAGTDATLKSLSALVARGMLQQHQEQQHQQQLAVQQQPVNTPRPQLLQQQQQEEAQPAAAQAAGEPTEQAAVLRVLQRLEGKVDVLAERQAGLLAAVQQLDGRLAALEVWGRAAMAAAGR